jgi:serine/threonine protein kinase
VSSEFENRKNHIKTTEPFSPADLPTETMGGEGSSSSVMLHAGEVVAERYRIDELIGSGGMGVVYRAYDLELDEAVALKVLQPSELGDSESLISRFKQEIKLARKIVHPNVCRIYDFGSWGEIKFVTMELLRGRTLDTLLQDPGDLDLDGKIELFRGILTGLRAAHRLQIIHRDLKPQNVMITPDNRPVIMDFGLAREIETSGDTGSSEVFGTPSFMAPEHLMGKKLDHRCDIYALGVILFELVTGRKPFTGTTIFEIAQKQLTEEPPRPATFDPELPPWLGDMIVKLLQRRPEDRFQSVDEMLDLVEARRDVGRKKVLLIEDDPVFRTLAEAHLSRAGIEVISAPNGAQGIELLLSEEPDLVCLDFRLPEMDGFHVATYIQRLDDARRPPIFMMTAIQDPQYEKQAARLGIERFFTKPVDGKELAEAVIERLSET